MVNSKTADPVGVNIFLLSGRSGSGKSTVAYEVCHRLSSPALDIPHVHIEGDGLDFVHPKETDVEQDKPNMLLTNLGSVFSNYYRYRRRSCRIVLISGTGMVLRWQQIKKVVEEACAAVDHTDNSVAPAEIRIKGIILRASDDIVAVRLTQREIGTALQRHLDSSCRMAEVLDKEYGEAAGSPLPVTWFDSEEGTVVEIAARIVECMTESCGLQA